MRYLRSLVCETWSKINILDDLDVRLFIWRSNRKTKRIISEEKSIYKLRNSYLDGGTFNQSEKFLPWRRHIQPECHTRLHSRHPLNCQGRCRFCHRRHHRIWKWEWSAHQWLFLNPTKNGNDKKISTLSIKTKGRIICKTRSEWRLKFLGLKRNRTENYFIKLSIKLVTWSATSTCEDVYLNGQ